MKDVDGAGAEHRDRDPARVTLARLAETDDVCGSEPPRVVKGPDGGFWVPGDCWCTREPGHEGDCLCEICADRHGAPGWSGVAG